MSTSSAEAMQDLEEFHHGREVEIACDTCGETWIVGVRDGEDVTYDQTLCPVAGCPGEGEAI